MSANLCIQHRYRQGEEMLGNRALAEPLPVDFVGFWVAAANRNVQVGQRPCTFQTPVNGALLHMQALQSSRRKVALESPESPMRRKNTTTQCRPLRPGYRAQL